jgi:SAM-dependent methyltransferase
MTRSLFRTLALSCVAVMMACEAPLAQQAKPYEPTVGQQGKDVVWVPTPQALVDRMLDMARVTVDDYVVDLGSGDGRTVITAAKRGVKARGIEYNPDMVELSKKNAAAAGVGNLATLERGDIFESKFSDATVVTLFLLPDLNLRLRPILLDMKPGTRVVSNTFDMGDWEPEARIQAHGDNCTSYCTAMLWIVPAKVAGAWRLPQGELTLQQEYQMLTGTLNAGGKTELISDGKMQGDNITFKVGDRIYRGKVEGGKMQGVFATETKWEATRR